jgi:hypothetical protein
MSKYRDIRKYGVNHCFKNESDDENSDEENISYGGKEIFLRNANIIIENKGNSKNQLNKACKEFHSKCNGYELNNIKKVLKYFGCKHNRNRNIL